MRAVVRYTYTWREPAGERLLYLTSVTSPHRYGYPCMPWEAVAAVRGLRIGYFARYAWDIP